MRHRARLERMLEFEQKGEDLESNLAECKKQLEEARARLRDLRGGEKEEEAEVREAQAEVSKLRKDEKMFEKMIEEHSREKKKLPWNVDTISKEGFSKSSLNIKPASEEATEEERKENRETFVEKYQKQMKHFGMMRRWDDSQKYLSDNPHLVCEETANYLVGVCVDLEVDERRALMEQVAHQTVVMQLILDLAQTLKVDPRGCFRQFFSQIKTADEPYLAAFNQELKALKERVSSCARSRIESKTKELEEEEEERPIRLGPGGLDPAEVYESLPEEMQRGFDQRDVKMLQKALSKLDPQEGRYHLSRCIDSGLWVPDSGEGDDNDDSDEDED
ncbi:hsp90 co-chaperone Cdc37-like [Genypterus blacodes]|uniref:hsp90 co-chaperone Cdc37-like n=1 Tax=Genypterus blacodes TaxID=154954 RepID=UPI003F76D5F6